MDVDPCYLVFQYPPLAGFQYLKETFLDGMPEMVEVMKNQDRREVTSILLFGYTSAKGVTSLTQCPLRTSLGKETVPSPGKRRRAPSQGSELLLGDWTVSSGSIPFWECITCLRPSSRAAAHQLLISDRPPVTPRLTLASGMMKLH